MTDSELVYLSEDQKKSMTKLGRQLENPYSVTNMQIAWDSLRAGSSSRDEDIAVITTHYYVKFSPQNENKLEIIKDDTTLTLYDSPLDYEIDSIGAYYHDPDVPLHKPTPQYCAVEANYIFPNNVKYEILEELFIPDDYSDNNSGRLASSSLIKELVNTSLRLTGNLDSDNKNNDANNGRVAMANWRPAGRIMVWDENIGVSSVPKRVVDYYVCYDCETDVRVTCHINENARISQCRRPIYQTIYIDVDGSNVPVRGVEVRALRWFTTHKGFSGVDGRFTCDGTFDKEAHYSFKWERNHYTIRSGDFGEAKYDGPQTKGDWNVMIGENSIQQFYAAIHLGAHRYYYENILGLSRPPLNSFFQNKMRIGAYDKDGRGNHWEDRQYNILDNWINIYRKGEQDQQIRSLFRNHSTTLHELAHASHWEFRKGMWDFNMTSDKLKESWAMGVAWSLNGLRYPQNNPWDQLDFDWMRTEGEGEGIYTPLIMDLIDNTNQGVGNINRPFDRVTGYTISDIEAVIGGSNNIQSLNQNLRNRYPNNPTRFVHDELFQQYENLAR
jgi:hypothetical protein